jgi:hypothetical protein
VNSYTDLKIEDQAMARVEGRDTARAGGSPEDNPYPSGTGEHRWWAQGFRQAMAYQQQAAE